LQGSEQAMPLASALSRLKRSLVESSGTIVFGMEDGTVSIFGLVFGVAATTSSNATVLIAGASGAAAAAVSMMAGAYLDAETSRDETAANDARLEADLARDPAAIATTLSSRLAEVQMTPALSAALLGAVQASPDASRGLLIALQSPTSQTPINPREQALWMLVADFLSAAIPILPFMLLPVSSARIVSAAVTIMLLIALGLGRARIGRRAIMRTVTETVSIGLAAALAGVAIGMLIDHGYSG
jgi:VIT1/CCC1 family predicted Fe2+/Mn2+ transporter